MTLRTSLEASKRLKEAGIVIDKCEETGVDTDRFVAQQFPWEYDAPSLDELLRTKEARERDIDIGWDAGSLLVQYYDRKKDALLCHDCGPDMQQAIDFIAALISERT